MVRGAGPGPAAIGRAVMMKKLSASTFAWRWSTWSRSRSGKPRPRPLDRGRGFRRYGRPRPALADLGRPARGCGDWGAYLGRPPVRPAVTAAPAPGSGAVGGW